MRQRLLPARPCQVVAWDGVKLEARDVEQAQTVDTVILLPPQQVLIRALRLPVLALRRLRDVVGFEIERQTPFAADQVHFDAVPTAVPPKGAATVDVLLIVAPKAVVNAVRQEAAENLPRLVGIDVLGTNGTPLGANLLPLAWRFRPSARWRKWNIALGCMSLVAAFGLLLGLLRAREDAVDQLEEQARPILNSAVRVERRQRELVGLQDRLAQTHTRDNASVSALQLLSEVSAVLPTDTHLLHLRLNRPTISVRGRTQDLSTLLEALSKSSLWGDPKLTGTRALPEKQGEEFSLELKVRTGNVGQ